MPLQEKYFPPLLLSFKHRPVFNTVLVVFFSPFFVFWFYDGVRKDLLGLVMRGWIFDRDSGINPF